jgi:hypothetical protein
LTSRFSPHGACYEMPGRPDLMQWMTRISAILRQVDPRNVNGLLLKQLKSDLGYGHFYNVFEELLTRKEESAIGAMGMLSTIIGLATDPIGLSALLGVAASAYPLGKGLIRQLGYAPATFSGPQWPFLYTYGKQPKRRQLKQVRYVLDELGRRESGAH